MLPAFSAQVPTPLRWLLNIILIVFYYTIAGAIMSITLTAVMGSQWTDLEVYKQQVVIAFPEILVVLFLLFFGRKILLSTK